MASLRVVQRATSQMLRVLLGSTLFPHRRIVFLEEEMSASATVRTVALEISHCVSCLGLGSGLISGGDLVEMLCNNHLINLLL